MTAFAAVPRESPAAPARWPRSALLRALVGAGAVFGPRPLRSLALRLTDLGLALPSLVVAIAVVGALGPGLGTALLAVAVTGWAHPARLYRALIAGEAAAGHVLAARALGASEPAVVVRHVLPGVAGRGAVVAAVALGRIVLSLSALAFLGLGPQPPAPEWGAMLQESRLLFLEAPALLLLPGAAVAAVVGAANVLADSLAATLDERPV